MLITSGVIMNWYYLKRADLDIIKFWKESFPVITLGFFMVFVTYWIKRCIVIKLNSIVSFGIQVLIFTVVYLILMYIFIMKIEEKNQVINIFKRRK